MYLQFGLILLEIFKTGDLLHISDDQGPIVKFFVLNLIKLTKFRDRILKYSEEENCVSSSENSEVIQFASSL